MILKIRNSFLGRSFSISMIVVMFFTMIAPINSYGLTGGPAQPEFSSFTPIGTSDMVDLASGDFSYNIPVMDIGGFPINLAYSSGVTMDQEASWVGLGWNLSIGQINRQMRGVPDDFEGDQMTYENDMKDDFTVGLNFKVTPNLSGVEMSAPNFQGTNNDAGVGISVGATMQYNSYNGMSITPSAGISFAINDNIGIGLDMSSSPDGMSLSPSASLSLKKEAEDKKSGVGLGLKAGVGFNSRQGLSNVNMSASFSGFYISEKAGETEGMKNSYTQNLGSSISYMPNHYTPQIQGNLMSEDYTFNVALLGAEYFGIEGNWQFRAFVSNQYTPDYANTTKEKAYGYDNNHTASENDVKDFNREKDGSFTKNTTNLPLTNYTYDIYSVKGQGVSGMFRPYRSQIGFVNDNYSSTFSNGGALGIEQGQGNTVKVGADIETTNIEAHGGAWNTEGGNNAMTHLTSEENSNKSYEEVYYKNVGDLSADSYLETSDYHDYGPMRLQIGPEKYDRKLLTTYEYKNEDLVNLGTNSDYKRSERNKRNQTILKVRNDEITTADGTLLGFTSNTHAKGHHTAGFIVTRNDGARYVYGESLYNISKKEVTFATRYVGESNSGLVLYVPNEDNNVDKNKNNDHFYNSVETPAYAHTYLLTTLLSTDYSDTDQSEGNEGPSDNDLGSYTKFTYSDAGDYKWRVPYQFSKANYNEGLRSNKEDDRGSYVYGEKETKYIKQIETKTHIAIFHTSPREDGHGVLGENGGLGTASKMEKLDKVSLYSKAEYYDEDGEVITTAVPIKEAHFVYNYDLCEGIHNNENGGKLTLEKVYFTYRGSNMGKYSPYVFDYGTSNPDYNLKAYDIWGNYKPNTVTTTTSNAADSITVPEFNYIEQDEDILAKSDFDDYTSAWSLKKISLPSGGNIDVEYESDDYRYVQDKEAMRMFKVAGAGKYSVPINFHPNSIEHAKLDRIGGIGFGKDARYLYIKLPKHDDSTIGTDEFYDNYIKEIAQNYGGLVQFRFLLNMDKKGGKNGTTSDSDFNSTNFDYVDGYFELADGNFNNSVFLHGNEKYASIAMKHVDMEGGFAGSSPVNPISKAGWQFGRKKLSKQVYQLGGVDETQDAGVIVKTVYQSFQNMKEIFSGPNGVLRGKKVARRFVPKKSWIRLMNPNKSKKGGGCRVRSIAMSDKWGEMTKLEGPINGANISTIQSDERDQEYGQVYDYTTEDELGNEYSSGVATYEPMGAKDNPFIQAVMVNTKRLLAPDDGNYMETPFGESFFPSATVTYSKVTVSNLPRKDPTDSNIEVKKHATGKVVTEFYTSKDYPTLCDQTKLDIIEDGAGAGAQLLQSFLKVNVRKHLTLSQGYVVHVNDMNGKMKKQLVYAEDQPTPISGVSYLYEGFQVNPSGDFTDDLQSTNGGNIDNEVDVLYPDGSLSKTKLGVEIDIINDFREKTTETTVAGMNINTATFIAGIPILIPIPLPDYSHHEEKLNLAITTKVINTFGIQKEVIAFDNGTSVSTKNLLWDSETGSVLLTETTNEYDDKYYSLNYPVHWYYKGMAAACFNSGVELKLTASTSGTYTVTTGNAEALFHPGDEVIMKDDENIQLWVNDVTSTTIDLITREGNPYVGVGTKLKIIRSGRRNLQSASMGSVVLQKNPLDLINGLPNSKINLDFLAFSAGNALANRVINSGAVEFKDDWGVECVPGDDNPTVNEYVKNRKGVWRAVKSWLYLTSRLHNKGVQGANDALSTESDDKVDPRNDGFYSTFSPFYKIINGVWDIDETDWTYTSEVTEYSPYGFELENKDALGRYSSAQYGYNFMFPMAVSANARYNEIGFDGFEDYGFEGSDDAHFNFKNAGGEAIKTKSHTGKYSLKVLGGASITKIYHINCQN